jgi:hypothetical protein
MIDSKIDSFEAAKEVHMTEFRNVLRAFVVSSILVTGIRGSACNESIEISNVNTDEWAARIYKSSDLVGTFEVISTDAFTGHEPEIAGRYYEDVKLKPMRIYKGHAGRSYTHQHVGLNNHKAHPFLPGKKYLIAFSNSDISEDRRNVACSDIMYVELKSSKNLAGRFQKLKGKN